MTIQAALDGYTVFAMWAGLGALLMLPFAVFRRIRLYSGMVYLAVSAVFGLGLWVLSAMLVYVYWGGFAVLLGVFFLGVGVFPMAIIIVVWHHLWDMTWLLFSWGAPIILFRLIGGWLLSSVRT